ncbi:MAG TPA: DUF2474 domain-containing protein [Methylophilus sp.]|nr:DUF2474 domain-containing protein [Methylophilus sp.]
MHNEPKHHIAKNSLTKRLGWLLLIWIVSVGVLAIASLSIKLLMQIAGFHA